MVFGKVGVFILVNVVIIRCSCINRLIHQNLRVLSEGYA